MSARVLERSQLRCAVCGLHCASWASTRGNRRSSSRARTSPRPASVRVDLRPTAAERLRDADEHDLAWVPTFFISGNVLERVIETVHCALRPDGYAIFGLYVRSDDPLATTLADLRTVRHGGVLLTPQDMAALLKRSGFADVDILFDVAWRTPVLFGRLCCFRGSVEG